jgi:hypothetical protein
VFITVNEGEFLSVLEILTSVLCYKMKHIPGEIRLLRFIFLITPSYNSLENEKQKILSYLCHSVVFHRLEHSKPFR